MKLLLKDALKALCRSNHWSYAVFWRCGWKNSRLLIWEECHYESSSCSFTLDCENESLKSPFGELMGRLPTSENFSAQLEMGRGVNVDSLIDKMILNNQIIAVGEGMVGRAAFTGSHHWILSKNYTVDADPSKVVEEVHEQFSAGIQTIAVIPIPLRGVVQFGSSCAIMESMGFVNDVRNLILNFGEFPDATIRTENNNGMKMGLNCSLGRESKDYSHHLIPTLQMPDLIQNSHNGMMKPEDSLRELEKNRVTIASMISPKPDAFLSQLDCLSDGFDCQHCLFQSISGNGNLKLIEGSVLSDTDSHIDKCYSNPLNHAALSEKSYITNPFLEGCILDDGRNVNLNRLAVDGNHHFGIDVGTDIRRTGLADHLTNEFLPTNYKHLPSNVKCSQGELNPTRSSIDFGLFQALDKTLTQSAGGSQSANPRHTGDELSYVLGVVDEKNTFDESLSTLHAKWADNMDEEMNSASRTLSTAVADETASDNLLESVISKAHFTSKQDSNDDVSCRTTLTMPSISWQNSTKTTSVCGSQISSWVDQANSVKGSSCISTVKRSGEVNKSGRKRLKPGEHPRPRPKDRQMIQDRLRELREIVPNGAKYSIDALLERTIKHMLFLQSVTKHADKLKQTGDSKIIRKESGLFLKDNFEHGASWAFEVGSQSMSCPIIIEDLNSPRQMLIEMVCEERGFFLEIADLIREMGLTILKGMMEARNGQLWAQFTIEANRDGTRMEVFMSLMHLLEHTMKGESLPDSIKNKQVAACDPSRSAPISATGGFCNLH